jgi:hypothetical protein
LARFFAPTSDLSKLRFNFTSSGGVSSDEMVRLRVGVPVRVASGQIFVLSTRAARGEELGLGNILNSGTQGSQWQGQVATVTFNKRDHVIFT